MGFLGVAQSNEILDVAQPITVSSRGHGDYTFGFWADCARLRSIYPERPNFGAYGMGAYGPTDRNSLGENAQFS